MFGTSLCEALFLSFFIRALYTCQGGENKTIFLDQPNWRMFMPWDQNTVHKYLLDSVSL